MDYKDRLLELFKCKKEKNQNSWLSYYYALEKEEKREKQEYKEIIELLDNLKDYCLKNS